ncbi:hypothetical protein T440DRAFT_481187 [Plenodomus tracheiphilus IPT5]|uniref:Uncharacterized protein n=1 Tax=Plenodomus tracheiphilus IPT5 TaxID=1408161 RepID=A0A6A7AZ67_9PLEO|nr:hypothetical protein T440DRAFT_481187 [Plenodomus tracheiphilus IPT5]
MAVAALFAALCCHHTEKGDHNAVVRATHNRSDSCPQPSISSPRLRSIVDRRDWFAAHSSGLSAPYAQFVCNKADTLAHKALEDASHVSEFVIVESKEWDGPGNSKY